MYQLGSLNPYADPNQLAMRGFYGFPGIQQPFPQSMGRGMGFPGLHEMFQMGQMPQINRGPGFPGIRQPVPRMWGIRQPYRMAPSGTQAPGFQQPIQLGMGVQRTQSPMSLGTGATGGRPSPTMNPYASYRESAQR